MPKSHFYRFYNIIILPVLFRFWSILSWFFFYMVWSYLLRFISFHLTSSSNTFCCVRLSFPIELPQHLCWNIYVSLFLDFECCFSSLYVCPYIKITLSWLLSLCSKFWNHVFQLPPVYWWFGCCGSFAFPHTF